MLARPSTAQTFTTLHSFSIVNPVTGAIDGASPYGGLVLSGNTLYGTTSGNVWVADWGTVFAVRTDGTGFTTLHEFLSPYDNIGAVPYAELILSGTTLYGTARYGGIGGNGTVFSFNTDGTSFRNLHSFDASNEGMGPQAGLVLSGTTLFGTTYYGGGTNSPGRGSVFAVNTDGTGFENPHTFMIGDGAYPVSGLRSSGSTLYGTASGGGVTGNGTVFAIKSDFTGFTNLYFFTATYPNYSANVLTNAEGSKPYGGLVLSGDTLYGTTTEGGSWGGGTVFALKIDGSSISTLHAFTATHPNSRGTYTNIDGANPYTGLILSGNTLYGTARYGGISGKGTVFALKTDGTGFTNLHSFTATVSGVNSDGANVSGINSDGANPYAGLILSGNTLYGTASMGGSWGYGTVFSLTIPGPPQLTLIPSGASVVIAWPTNTTSYILQSTAKLGSLAEWSTVPAGPAVIGGQNIIFYPLSGTQRFFRLSQ
jgi:uncharacterized repeat protein (TIGR03803 family)